MCIFVAAPAAGAASGAAAAGMSAATAAALNMALVSIATTAVQMRQQQANADAMAKHQQNVYDLQKEVSRADAISKYAALADKHREREIALGHTLMENQRKATEAQSMSRVMAGEGGVQGASVGLVLGDLEKQNQEYQMALLQQERFHDAQFMRQGEAIHAGHYAGILQNQPTPIPEPDYLGAAMGVGASALGTYYGVKYA